MRFNIKHRKLRKHFAIFPVRAQSRYLVNQKIVWLEWVEVGSNRYNAKIYYFIDKNKEVR